MVKKTEKADVTTVKQFAEEIGVTPARLLSQFKEAAINIGDEGDVISQEQKQRLLRYLQQHHGAKQEMSPEKIVFHRAKTSRMRLSHGEGTVSVRVLKKRTLVKRNLPEEETAAKGVIPTDLPPTLTTETKVTEPEAITTTLATPAVDTAVAEQTTYTEEVPTPSTTTELADDKAKATVKRKDKHRTDAELEEPEGERHKKRKKIRDTSRSGERNLESLLSRGADLSRVLKQEEDEIDLAIRKSGKNRLHAQGKVKIQAFTKPTEPIIHEVEIPETINVAELAQQMSVKVAEVIKILMKMGVMATINQVIDQDTAILVVEEMGHKARAVSFDAIENSLIQSLDVIQGEAKPRPPVVTIMGHVDHGKTTLLDYIRTTKVAAQEAGGITQHIGAYHVQTAKGTVTFLDTPGHAAFTAMRARGAKLTDIVILVVAADDGVMPQTVEAIQHAKAANVPIVVAINKMDKEGVDPERIKTELSRYGLIPEEWSGETMFVPISAKTGMGVDELLDSVLVQAEVLELKAVIDCSARGVVIESRVDRGRGAVTSVLVQQGTLNKGDIILAGLEYGRIRALFDETGKAVESATPSIPVEILGLSGVLQAGSDFIIVLDERRAREVAIFRQTKYREAKLARQTTKLEDLFQRIEDEKSSIKTLNIVLKADVLGSVEALKQALTELMTPEVKVNVISSGIGGINESDVNLAIASKAIIIAFNVRANVDARKLMETNSVDVHYHNIIYDVIDQVKKAISGALEPEIHERIVGLAQVREVFRSSKIGAVAGCMVIEGFVKRNFPIRVLRDNVVIFQGSLESLRRFKEDVSEVRSGMECGIAVKSYNDIKPGDQIEVYEKVQVKREK